MWQRILKNSNGTVKDILRSTDWGKEYRVTPLDYAEGVTYRVEYLRADNYDAFEAASYRYSSIDPWEVLDSYECDTFGEAAKEFALREIDGSNPVMFVTFPGGKEISATMPSEFGFLAKRAIAKDGSALILDLERKVKEQGSEIEQLRKELSTLRKML